MVCGRNGLWPTWYRAELTCTCMESLDRNIPSQIGDQDSATMPTSFRSSCVVLTHGAWTDTQINGVLPYWPQTISATARRYRPQPKTISTTRKIHIGHRPYPPQNIMVSLLHLIISLLHVYVIVSYSVSCCLSALSVVIWRDLFVSLFHFCVCQYETVVVNTTFSCHYRILDSYKAL